MALVAMLGGACGGQVDGTGPKPPDAGAHHDAAGGDGRGACPPIPTAPVYDCPVHSLLGTDCMPWKEQNSLFGYSQGCSVDLPEPDSFSNGCGPQRCQCSTVPSANGVSNPGWVCPL